MKKEYPLYDVLRFQNFHDCLNGLETHFGGRPAITQYSRKGEPETHTYRELVQDAKRFGAALAKQNLVGKHVAVAAENSYQWLCAFLGTVSVGSVAVCIDIEQPGETIVNMIAQADAAAVAVSRDVLSACRGLKEGGEIILLNTKGALENCFGNFCNKAEKEEVAAIWEQHVPNSEQTAVIVYTSGTTSTAKPVMLSQQGILQNASDSVGMILAPNNMFTSLPFFHTYGLTCSLLGNLFKGVHICINGNLKTTMRDLALFQPENMMAVPLIVETIHQKIWNALEQSGKKEQVKKLFRINRILKKFGLMWKRKEWNALREASVGNLKMIVCGGAHLSDEIARDMLDLGVLVLQGYGITECSPLISANRNEAYQLDSVGQVLPSIELKLVDGEILVRGVSVMQGYYKNPELTREQFADGWFRTGDLGHLDKNGFLYITGRKKNLIVFKNGKKVSPEEVEQKMKTIPMVKEVMAYGAVSGVSTDDVKLAVSVYPDPERTQGMTSYEILEQLQEQVDALNRELPAYKQIQMINIREDEFVKTSTRKIRRQIV